MVKRWTAMFLLLVLVFSLVPIKSFAAVAQDDPELLEYLQQVSTTRGFEITVEDFEDYLLEYFESGLEDWENFAEVQEYLGEVIEADYSNLQSIYEEYDLNHESLTLLLEENGDTLENYIYVEGLDGMVYFYTEDSLEEIPEEAFEDLFTEFGLTGEELEKLWAHLGSLQAKFEDPAVQQRLVELGEQMVNFEEFESVEELTDEQITQFLSIFNELLEIVELEPKFYLTKGDEVKPITLRELMMLKDPQGYHLLIELYNKNGELLLNMVLTPEMIGSEIIEEIGDDVKEVPDAVEEIKTSPNKPKTEKGGKLPNTASDFGSNGILGLSIAAAGYVLYRRVRKTA
jgi:processed acidic surface protein